MTLTHSAQAQPHFCVQGHKSCWIFYCHIGVRRVQRHYFTAAKELPRNAKTIFRRHSVSPAVCGKATTTTPCIMDESFSARQSRVLCYFFSALPNKIPPSLLPHDKHLYTHYIALLYHKRLSIGTLVKQTWGVCLSCDGINLEEPLGAVKVVAACQQPIDVLDNNFERARAL